MDESSKHCFSERSQLQNPTRHMIPLKRNFQNGQTYWEKNLICGCGELGRWSMAKGSWRIGFSFWDNENFLKFMAFIKFSTFLLVSWTFFLFLLCCWTESSLLRVTVWCHAWVLCEKVLPRRKEREDSGCFRWRSLWASGSPLFWTPSQFSWITPSRSLPSHASLIFWLLHEYYLWVTWL